jgi:hypothetical protein
VLPGDPIPSHSSSITHQARQPSRKRELKAVHCALPQPRRAPPNAHERTLAGTTSSAGSGLYGGSTLTWSTVHARHLQPCLVGVGVGTAEEEEEEEDEEDEEEEDHWP